MSTVLTGHQCRCPECRKMARHGVREEDSHVVSVCKSCGELLLDITQPQKKPMEEATRLALLGNGDDTARTVIARHKEKEVNMQHEDDRLNRLIVAINGAKQRTGIKSDVKLCAAMGRSSGYLGNIRIYARDGDCTKKVEEVIGVLSTMGSDAHKSAADKASKAETDPAPSAGRWLDDDLAAIRTQIDALLFARSRGIPARVVIDPVEVSAA